MIGGAIAPGLLFGIPLFAGGVLTGPSSLSASSVCRALASRPSRTGDHRPVWVILAGFLLTLLRVDLVPGEAVAGLIPRFEGTDSLLLATGILGATVMPHVIYLHSALTQNRIAADNVADRRFLFRHSQVDVLLAMGLAGVSTWRCC